MGNFNNTPVSHTTQAELDWSKFIGDWWIIAKTTVPTPSCESTKITFGDMVVGTSSKGNPQKQAPLTSVCYKGNQVTRVRRAILIRPNDQDPGKLLSYATLDSSPANLYVYWTDYTSAVIGNGKGGVDILSRDQQMKYCAFRPIYDSLKDMHITDNGNLKVNMEKFEKCVA